MIGTIRNTVRNTVINTVKLGAKVNYLLNSYPNAAVAYSLRKLKAGQQYAIRVRRDSDNEEKDIGFSGINLDTISLLSFVGDNNGFITKWFDQSGNNIDAIQSAATAQPTIISSGSLINENNVPFLSFDGTNDSIMTQAINSLASSDNGFMLLALTKPGASRVINISQYDINNKRVFSSRNLDFDAIEYALGIQPNGAFNNTRLARLAAPSSVHLFAGYWEGADKKLSVRINKGTPAESTASIPEINVIQQPLEIGSYNDLFGSARISELIIYRFFNNGFLDKVENAIYNYYKL